MSLTEAIETARSREMDVMEIGKKDDISIVKILDYGKFLYRQKKQDQKQKQHGKAPDIKTIRLTYKIGDHDLEVKKKQIEKFAQDGHPLKISLMLRGRENHYGELAAAKIEKFIESIAEFYKADAPVKRTGNTFHAMLKPKK